MEEGGAAVVFDEEEQEEEGEEGFEIQEIRRRSFTEGSHLPPFHRRFLDAVSNF